MLSQLPKNVKVLVILQILYTILLLITGIDSFFLHWFSPSLDGKFSPQIIQQTTHIFFPIFLFFGLLNLLLVYYLQKLKGWAWMTTLILRGVAILGYLIGLYQRTSTGGLNILLLVIEVVMIYYLLMPNVRRTFHRTRQDAI